MTPEKKEANMRREFVVVDAEGITWNAKTDAPERFKTFKAAKARSVEVAENKPGTAVCIYELTAETTATINVPSTARKHSLEHYS